MSFRTDYIKEMSELDNKMIELENLYNEYSDEIKKFKDNMEEKGQEVNTDDKLKQLQEKLDQIAGLREKIKNHKEKMIKRNEEQLNLDFYLNSIKERDPEGTWSVKYINKINESLTLKPLFTMTKFSKFNNDEFNKVRKSAYNKLYASKDFEFLPETGNIKKLILESNILEGEEIPEKKIKKFAYNFNKFVSLTSFQENSLFIYFFVLNLVNYRDNKLKEDQKLIFKENLIKLLKHF